MVRINRIGKYIEEKFAHKYYQEIGLGIDFTARDLQQNLKEKGLPWEKAKAFDGSALIGNWFNKNNFSDLNQLDFELVKNSETVQEGNTSQMIWSIDTLINEVSRFFTLKIGDIIFTGTPAGVGPVFENELCSVDLSMTDKDGKKKPVLSNEVIPIVPHLVKNNLPEWLTDGIKGMKVGETKTVKPPNPDGDIDRDG